MHPKYGDVGCRIGARRCQCLGRGRGTLYRCICRRGLLLKEDVSLRINAKISVQHGLVPPSSAGLRAFLSVYCR